jgi:hypothetical protein
MYLAINLIAEYKIKLIALQALFLMSYQFILRTIFRQAWERWQLVGMRGPYATTRARPV